MPFKIQELFIGLSHEVEVKNIKLNPEELAWYVDHTFCIPCTRIRCRERDDEYPSGEEDVVKVFSVLKEELNKRLKAGQITREEIAERLLPESVKAVDELRPKLLEALVELEKHRVKLLTEGKLG
jgi:hypothetical protein